MPRARTRHNPHPVSTRVAVIIEQAHIALGQARNIPTMTKKLQPSRNTALRDQAVSRIETAISHLIEADALLLKLR